MVNLPEPPSCFDVVVVGGGPAGLAAAIAIRRTGLSVLVADRSMPGIDKACGEGLMPDAIAALERLGVHVGQEHGHAFRGISFVENGRRAQSTFRHGIGLGIRRTRLHGLLTDRAAQVGVVLRWQSEVVPLSDETVSVAGSPVRFRWLVCADGLLSKARRWTGLDVSSQGERRVGVRKHFDVAPWADFVEVHWRPGCQAYVTPIAPDRVCVALIGGLNTPRFSDLRYLFPDLANRLDGAQATGPARGAVTASRRLPAVVRGNFALIGDASGFIDAITGEGMALAFRQAEMLAAALAAGDLTLYAKNHRKLGLKPLLMARALLLLGRNDQLRHGAIGLLAAQPWIFDRLLALHVGSGAGTDKPFEMLRADGVPS